MKLNVREEHVNESKELTAAIGHWVTKLGL